MDTELEEDGYCDVRKMLTVKTEEKKEDTYKTENLTTDQQREVKEVIRKNEDIFIKGKYEVGRTNMVKHTIDTGEEKPIKQKARSIGKLNLHKGTSIFG